jgi:hypothetical protein
VPRFSWGLKAKENAVRPSSRTGWALIVLFLCSSDALQAQAAAQPFPSWQTASPLAGSFEHQRWVPHAVPQSGLAAGSQVGTGLLVGSIIGAAATTVFLIGFCGDADTECGADEVGRAVLFIGVPAAALGAVVGSLFHKEDRELERAASGQAE